MTRRDPETNPAAFLGGELRRARLAAGFASQDALAGRLGFDRTVITKAETGERPPSVAVLAAWCRACGLDGELFGRLGVLARRGDGPLPVWFQDWVTHGEQLAVRLRWFEPHVVPGLLQTEAYARALLTGRIGNHAGTWKSGSGHGWNGRPSSPGKGTRRSSWRSWTRACCAARWAVPR